MLDDELEFLEFMGLYLLTGQTEDLNAYKLYNARSDEEFDFLEVNEFEVKYFLNERKISTRSISQLADYIVIAPKDSNLIKLKPSFKAFFGFNFFISYDDAPIFTAKSFITEEKASFSRVLNNIKLDDIFEELKKDIIDYIRHDHDAFCRNADNLNLSPEFESFLLEIDNQKIIRTYSHTLAERTDDKLISETVSDFTKEEAIELHCHKLISHLLKSEGSYHRLLYRLSKSETFLDVIRTQTLEIGTHHHLRIKFESNVVVDKISTGPAEQSLEIALQDIRQKYNLRLREILEEKHAKFLASNSQDALLPSISYENKQYFRQTHCWNCKKNIDNIDFATCNHCRGIICFCGACLCGFSSYY